MAIEYTPESSLVADPAEGGSFSAPNDAELAGAQSFAAKAKLAQIAAEQAETNAENSATSASGAASTASTFATNASNSATASANSATAAANSATDAANSATASANSATASAGSATASAGSATNAANSATTAAGSATAASDSATASANSATASANSATDSANSATASAGSATTAAGSATAASNSATAASNSATDSANSATDSANSATDSANSATASGNSATASANSATAASNSETAAAGSATASANSATASANSATASAGSATSSSNSATSAATAQTAAEAARDAALAAFDSFDDRYLGAKASDPTTDNDGDALAAGMLYYNTTDDVMKVYEGSSWVAAYASLSSALLANNNLSDLNNAATARTNLGLGTIATAAATDYVPTTGGTFTGNVESPEFIGTLQGEVVFKAKAGEAITKGDAVYVSGISGNTPVVSKADADDAAKMPAFGLSADTVSANAAMEVVILGQLTNMDTSGYTLGDTLYISNTPGVLSATKPAGESSQLQNIGKVERVHASTGSILVSGSGRSAATPNLNDGQFFLGNGSNQAVSTDFTTSVLGEISAGTGIGISGGGVISNSAPDQTVSLTGTGATSVTGTYPNFTIDSSDNNTTYTAGTGLSLTGTEFANTAPDQTVSLTGAGATTVSGTYPNFTITGSDTTYTASNGITLSGTDFQLTDTNAKLNLTGGTITSGGNIGLKVSHDDFQEGIISYRNHASNSASYVFENASGRTGTLYTQNDFPMWRDGTTSNSHKVWTQGNDGSGSGLDADTLDGVEASGFLRSDATTTFDSAGNNLEIDGDGTDRIGLLWKEGTQRHWEQYITATDDLQFKSITGGEFQVVGDLTVDNGTNTTVNVVADDNGMSQLRLYGSSQGTGRLFVGQSTAYGGGIEYNGDNSPSTTGSGSDEITLYRISNNTVSWTAKNHVNSNDWNFRGNVTAYASDKRLKENIETIPNALDKVTQLRGVTFDWKDDVEEKGFLPSMKHETGVIAQEVQKVIPDAVVPAPFDNEYLTVQHEKIIPVLIEAIKELKAEVEELKGAK